MVKLVSESLQENVLDRLNEQMNAVDENVLTDFIKAVKKLTGDLATAWESVKKDDDKELRKFAFKAATDTYVANNPEAGKKAFEAWAKATPIENIKKYLGEASKSGFSGRSAVSYVMEGGKKVPAVTWKDMKTVNLASGFKSGGTGGQTTFGGS